MSFYTTGLCSLCYFNSVWNFLKARPTVCLFCTMPNVCWFFQVSSQCLQHSKALSFLPVVPSSLSTPPSFNWDNCLVWFQELGCHSPWWWLCWRQWHSYRAECDIRNQPSEAPLIHSVWALSKTRTGFQQGKAPSFQQARVVLCKAAALVCGLSVRILSSSVLSFKDPKGTRLLSRM